MFRHAVTPTTHIVYRTLLLLLTLPKPAGASCSSHVSPSQLAHSTRLQCVPCVSVRGIVVVGVALVRVCGSGTLACRLDLVQPWCSAARCSAWVAWLLQPLAIAM